MRALMEATAGSVAPKRPERTVRRVASLLGEPRAWAGIEAVPVVEIDATDQRFQLRLEARSRDLISSLRAGGQRTPVILWGRRRPYVIIDGFRRVAATAALKRPTIQAIIRDDLDEAAAFSLAFSENCQRDSLRPRDKAYAVWLAVHRWGMAKPQVASSFSLSVRQIDRYLKVFDLEPELLNAIVETRISMGHAFLLHQYGVADVSTWIQEIERQKLSAAELRRQLRPRSRARGPRTYLVRDDSGFRLRPIRYRRGMSAVEKRRIEEALELALRIVQSS
jgi:ParB/RepB/Spo0J family partition protein